MQAGHADMSDELEDAKARLHAAKESLDLGKKAQVCFPVAG